MEGERCDFCEEGLLILREVREYYRHRDDLIVIDNVPTYVCNVCGERYHAAEVAKRLRRIAENKHLIQATQSFPHTVFERDTIVEPST